MDDKILEVRMEKWRKVLALQLDSGLTQTEWCLNNGIRRRQFQYWQKKIRDYELSKMSTSDQIQNARTENTTMVTTVASSPQMFAELPCIDSSATEVITEISSADTKTQDMLTLMYNDFQINIHDSFNEGTLAKVLKVIKNVK